MVLAKRYRLHKQHDILSVLRDGRRIHTPYVTICIKSNQSVGHARLAVVAGKKVHPSAVRRHRYQRWLREVARAHILHLPAADIVLLATPSLRTVSSFQILNDSLDLFLRKLHIAI